MTYFADLSDYEYLPSDEPMLNVGWLGDGHEFPTGTVDPVLRDALVDLAADPRNVTRGLHYCEYCDVDSPIRVTRTDDPTRRASLGFAEIHVRSGALVYAAPTMLIHYLDAHDYLPPRQFCDAVEALGA